MEYNSTWLYKTTQFFFKCIDDLHKLLTRLIIVVYAKRVCGHPKKKIEFPGFIAH